MAKYSGVRVFSASTHSQREVLAESVTRWLRRKRPLIVAKEVRQSSDLAYHCLTLVFFFRERH
jgi:hypothetical protein